jgi:hypothetical protein
MGFLGRLCDPRGNSTYWSPFGEKMMRKEIDRSLILAMLRLIARGRIEISANQSGIVIIAENALAIIGAILVVIVMLRW